MEGKKAWYQSSTILLALLTVVINAYIGASEIPGLGLPDIPAWLVAVLNSLLGVGIVNGRARATRVIGGTLPR